jgi:carbamate kinase
LVTKAVVAIGGNSLIRSHETGTKEEQQKNLDAMTLHIANLIRSQYKVVITHGNGPQVGNILLRNDVAEGFAPVMPMDVCVAESQGQIGYMIQQSLANCFKQQNISASVTSIITQVVVDEKDDAFENPQKPVGPYYPEDEALRLSKEKGWSMMEDIARQGYRRVVPSPKPLEIVEREIILQMINADDENVIIALGGGGIPVIRTKTGFSGIEAVIDKDLASSLLASIIKADLLIMITDVENVAINFQKPNQEDLEEITLSQAKQYLKEGHFPPGSMGPKILSAIGFLESGGSNVIITTSENIENAIENKKGTRIILG